jgi:hypothetical protein
MIKRNFAVFSMLAMLALYALVTPVSAQSPTGTLRGVVLDPQGTLVPNATVAATNEGTNASVTTTTSSAGVYVFPGLLKLTNPAFSQSRSKPRVAVADARRITADRVLFMRVQAGV